MAKLTAADAAAYDDFGVSVAIDGDTVVVGAYWDDDGGTNSGSAYVFRTTDGGGTYGQVAKLTAADTASFDRFGVSVAIDGSTQLQGCGLRLPHERRRRHVRPGGQANCQRRLDV